VYLVVRPRPDVVTDDRSFKGTESGETLDQRFMRLALDEARAALEHEDVPVGAVVLDRDGTVLGRGRNRRELDEDPTGHAEVVALREAARARKRWRLEGTILVVTLEPCAMCAGALVNARVDRLVFGARDPRAGAVESLYRICDDPRLNRLAVTGGVREEECGRLLRDFFRARRGPQPPGP
jgi:tRNA(adenine34) deaminase